MIVNYESIVPQITYKDEKQVAMSFKLIMRDPVIKCDLHLNLLVCRHTQNSCTLLYQRRDGIIHWS